MLTDRPPSTRASSVGDRIISRSSRQHGAAGKPKQVTEQCRTYPDGRDWGAPPRPIRPAWRWPDGGVTGRDDERLAMRSLIGYELRHAGEPAAMKRADCAQPRAHEPPRIPGRIRTHVGPRLTRLAARKALHCRATARDRQHARWTARSTASSSSVRRVRAASDQARSAVHSVPAVRHLGSQEPDG